jgi:hypothetical protein
VFARLTGSRRRPPGSAECGASGKGQRQDNKSPGDFPKHAEELRGHVLASLGIARKRMPNLRIAYLSSRIYAGYAATPLNPEPYACESALAVRRLILDQAKGDAALNWDPSRGDVRAPLLLWGPYLWADGTTPRKSDGLVWNREDLAPDGTHPSPASGRDKVAGLLLRAYPENRGSGIFIEANAPLRLLQEGSYPTVTAGLHEYANQSPTAGSPSDTSSLARP